MYVAKPLYKNVKFSLKCEKRGAPDLLYVVVCEIMCFYGNGILLVS